MWADPESGRRKRWLLVCMVLVGVREIMDQAGVITIRVRYANNQQEPVRYVVIGGLLILTKWEGTRFNCPDGGMDNPDTEYNVDHMLEITQV